MIVGETVNLKGVYITPLAEQPGNDPASGTTGTVEGKKESHTASSSGSSMTSWGKNKRSDSMMGPVKGSISEGNRRKEICNHI